MNLFVILNSNTHTEIIYFDEESLAKLRNKIMSVYVCNIYASVLMCYFSFKDILLYVYLYFVSHDYPFIYLNRKFCIINNLIIVAYEFIIHNTHARLYCVM